ncbi:MAG: hypothetical protein O3C40_03490 [Planctomycetota bacterium]|nr:hypothetical protein [Planctomycetota bacterium]
MIAGQKSPIARDDELLRLGGMPRGQWGRVLNETIARAGGQSVTLPPDDNSQWWERVKRLSDDGRPLFLQILGICLARRPQYVDELTAGDQGLEALLDDMLRYEREHHWVELFNHPNVQTTDDEFRAVERAVGFITLVGGIIWPRDEDALHACAGGSRETIERVVPLILKSRAEPDTGEYTIPPLQPDLLGERLLVNLARRIVDQPRRIGAPRPADPIDTDFWIRHALRANESGTIETVRLLAQDFSHAPETIQWTEALLRALAERFSTTDEDDDAIEHRKPMFDLSSRVSQVMRTLASARDRLDEPTQRLFLQLACANRWAWLGALDAFFLDISRESTATVLNRIEPLRRALAETPARAADAPHFASILASNLMIALSQHGQVGQFPQLEAWGDVLKRQAEQHPDHDDIQLELAKGAVNAINYYGGAQQFPQLEAWGDVLKRQAEQHPAHDDIQLELAKGAVNAINYYGHAQQFPQLEAWGDVLKRQAAQHPAHDDIQLELAQGAVVVLVLHIELTPDGREAWGKHLDAGLARSRVSAEEFAKWLRFCIARLADERWRRNATDVLVRLARFRPGFMVDDESPSQPLAALVAGLPDLGENTRDELASLR